MNIQPVSEAIIEEMNRRIREDEVSHDDLAMFCYSLARLKEVNEPVKDVIKGRTDG